VVLTQSNVRRQGRGKGEVREGNKVQHPGCQKYKRGRKPKWLDCIGKRLWGKPSPWLESWKERVSRGWDVPATS
jgi:phage terminase small subunit